MLIPHPNRVACSRICRHQALVGPQVDDKMGGPAASERRHGLRTCWWMPRTGAKACRAPSAAPRTRLARRLSSPGISSGCDGWICEGHGVVLGGMLLTLRVMVHTPVKLSVLLQVPGAGQHAIVPSGMRHAEAKPIHDHSTPSAVHVGSIQDRLCSGTSCFLRRVQQHALRGCGLRTCPGPLAIAWLVAMVPLFDADPPAVTAPTGVLKLKLNGMSSVSKNICTSCGQVRSRCRNLPACPVAADEARCSNATLRVHRRSPGGHGHIVFCMPWLLSCAAPHIPRQSAVGIVPANASLPSARLVPHLCS